MPVLLLGIGIFAVVAGLAMIGFGIPINEFSFGNTLINAGTTAAVGGLVIVAVSVAVKQLRRIAEALADPANARLILPAEEADLGAAMRKGSGLGSGLGPALAPVLAPAPGRAPYPQKPRERPAADNFGADPDAEYAPMDEPLDESFAPALRNPDEAPVSVDDDISLSPRHPQGAPAPAGMPPGSLDKSSDSFDWRLPPSGPGASSAPRAPSGSGGSGGPSGSGGSGAPNAPAARPQQANFDAMWPADGKPPAKAPSAGAPAAPRGGSGAEQKADALAREAAKPRTVAILKSGVVDGMGYTLYVDGSIEAELPQGTLRFASINELRSHLEKNS
jgi:hypothetical protein